MNTNRLRRNISMNNPNKRYNNAVGFFTGFQRKIKAVSYFLMFMV